MNARQPDSSPRALSVRFAISAAILLGAGLLAASAEAPTLPPKPGDKDYTAEVTVRVGEVQVLVTDKDNRPVLGLKPDEVEVREAGDSRRIAYVEPFATKDLVVRLLPQATPLIPANGGARPAADVVESAPAFPAPRPVRRYVLLFDGYNTRTFDRDRWVKGATAWVGKTMRADDTVAIAIIEKGTIRVIQNFTSDKNVLLQILSTSGFMPAGDYHDFANDVTEIRNNLLACDNAYDKLQCSVNAATPVVNDWSNRTVSTITALREYCSTLAAIPGRKAVLLVSNGVVTDPGALAGAAIMSKLGTDTVDYTTAQSLFQVRFPGELLDLGRVAAASSVTFFTFDTRSSSRRDMLGDVDQRQIDSMNTTVDPYAQVFDATRGSLDALAEQTGGRSSNGPVIEKNLPAAAESIEGLYTIGFYRDTGTGRAPKVKVKVRRKGAEVTFVDRYDPLRTLPQVVHLEIGIGKPRPFEQQVEVPIIVQLPIDDISFRKSEGTWTTDVGLYVEAVTTDGSRTGMAFETVTLTFDDVGYDKRFGRKFEHTLALRVPPGAYRVRVRATDSAFKHAAERAVDLTVNGDFTVRPGIQNSVQNQNPGQLTNPPTAPPVANSSGK